ncbi:hypothetical protein FOL47_004016, partial [Perkinsus chesapeaki]
LFYLSPMLAINAAVLISAIFRYVSTIQIVYDITSKDAAYSGMFPNDVKNVVLRSVDPLGRFVFSGRGSDSTSILWRSSTELDSFDYISFDDIEIIDLDASHSVAEIFFVTTTCEFGIIDAHNFGITYIDNLSLSRLSGIVFDSANDAVYISSQSDHVVYRYKRISGMWMNKEVMVGEIGIPGNYGNLVDTPTSLEVAQRSLVIRSRGGLTVLDMKTEKLSFTALADSRSMGSHDLAFLPNGDNLVYINEA